MIIGGLLFNLLIAAFVAVIFLIRVFAVRLFVSIRVAAASKPHGNSSWRHVATLRSTFSEKFPQCAAFSRLAAMVNKTLPLVVPFRSCFPSQRDQIVCRIIVIHNTEGRAQ